MEGIGVWWWGRGEGGFRGGGEVGGKDEGDVVGVFGNDDEGQIGDRGCLAGLCFDETRGRFPRGFGRGLGAAVGEHGCLVFVLPEDAAVFILSHHRNS